nr:Stk1 family PASTA domain-containing Ser/Thr kinase [Microbacterium karelineae]
MADPLVGRLVDGRYRVRSRVARGGMATVYLATDLRLERRVALKVMHHHLSDDDRFQSRFIQEARAAARLSDPHVVSVFDQGQDDDIAYLVMEYLPGVTLRDLLNEQKRLPLDHAITVMHAVLSGLASAHRAGFIHRDVKPENVLIAEDGRIKIGDFGLARATTANTASGQQLLGTIAYLAPELVTQGTADARTDIYALGIMLYEMLTGEQPYQGEQPMQIAYQHATEQVPRPSFLNPAVPEQLDELVLWSTERTPDERPSDAQEMLDRLREIEEQLGIAPLPPRSRIAPAAPDDDDADDDGDGETRILPPSLDTGELTSVLGGTGPVGSAPATAGNAERLRVKTRRRRIRGAWATAIVLVLAIVTGGVGWWFGSGPGSMVLVPTFADDATFDDAERQLAALELGAIEETDHSLEVPEGRITAVSPAPGTQVYPGDSVTITTSLGPKAITLDSFRGFTLTQAEDYATDAGLRMPNNAIERYDARAPGDVIGARVSSPGSDSDYGCLDGCDAYQGYELEMTVSAGPIPDIANTPIDEARERLETARLIVADETERDFSDSIDAGSAIAVSPDPGDTAIHPGDTVTLIESMGPIPDVSGLSIDAARERLDGAGLEVEDATERWYHDSIAAGLAIGLVENPNGEAWHPGDTVTLVESLGPEPVAIPDVTGMTRDDAIATLEAEGFTVTYNGLWSAWPNDWTTVTGTDPAPGTEHVPAQTTVTIYIDNTGAV